MNSHTKIIHGVEYYTGAYPKIRSHFRKGNCPVEFGDRVWASSLVLIDYLVQEPFALKDKRVLEIGCGWGVLSIFLAKYFSCQVTASDIDAYVLPITKWNAELNEVALDIQQRDLQSFSQDELASYDLVLGTEICYSDEVAEYLLKFSERFMASADKRLLIADPGRPDFSDYANTCMNKFSSELIELAGSVNGKTTQVLSLVS